MLFAEWRKRPKQRYHHDAIITTEQRRPSSSIAAAAAAASRQQAAIAEATSPDHSPSSAISLTSSSSIKNAEQIRESYTNTKRGLSVLACKREETRVRCAKVPRDSCAGGKCHSQRCQRRIVRPRRTNYARSDGQCVPARSDHSHFLVHTSQPTICGDGGDDDKFSAVATCRSRRRLIHHTPTSH